MTVDSFGNRRERPVCRSGNVTNITRAVEWYHPIYGTPNVAAMIHRHMQRNEYNPCRQNGTTLRYVIPRERSESRNLPEWQILSCGGYYCNLGGFLHSADAKGLNDISGEWFRLSTQVIIATLHGDESSPLHCVYRWTYRV